MNEDVAQKVRQTLEGLAQAFANGRSAERKDIIACIRAGSWSGSEEIVKMIRERDK